EFGYLEQVELHDLEVRREVEVPWRDDGGELAAEHRRVGRRCAPEDPIAPAAAGGSEVAGRQRGKDREPDVVDGAPDETRADDLRRQPAAELEGAAPEPPGNQAHREEVPRQVEDVLQVVVVFELREDLVEYPAEVVPLESHGAADAEIQVR